MAMFENAAVIVFVAGLCSVTIGIAMLLVQIRNNTRTLITKTDALMAKLIEIKNR